MYVLIIISSTFSVHKVHNEWGPQTVHSFDHIRESNPDTSLPQSIAERVQNIESFLNITSVSKDVFRRLKDMEDKIAHLQTISPEYAQFWVRY
jgi:molybdopterin synthase catalytic subunit